MQNKYEVIEIVGEGAFGIVMKCKNKETCEIVAIKKFKDTEDEVVQKSMLRELKVLKKLKHDNIVQLKESFRRKGKLYLVFEYLEKNLLQVIEDNPSGLDQGLIKKIIYQICKAVIYVHSNDTLHRDIKPENILVTVDNLIKVCDFGFARGVPQKGGILTDYVATRWYRAPELLLGSTNYGKEVDFWAIGCIMGELTDGQPMFPGDNELSQLILIQKVLGNLPQSQLEIFYSNPMYTGNKLEQVVKPETLERRYFGKFSGGNKYALPFLKLLLKLDPRERGSGQEILMHNYFDDVRENDPDFAFLKNQMNSTRMNFQQGTKTGGISINNTNLGQNNQTHNRNNKFSNQTQNGTLSNVNNTKTNFFQNSNLSKSPPRDGSLHQNNKNQPQQQIRIPKKFQINYDNQNNQQNLTINSQQNNNNNTQQINQNITQITTNQPNQGINLNNMNNGLYKTGYKSFYNIPENKDDVYNFEIETKFEEGRIERERENKPEIIPYNKKKKGGAPFGAVPVSNMANLRIIEEEDQHIKKGEKNILAPTKFKPDTGSEIYEEETNNQIQLQNKIHQGSPKNITIGGQMGPGGQGGPKNHQTGIISNFNFLPQISTTYRGFEYKSKLK